MHIRERQEEILESICLEDKDIRPMRDAIEGALGSKNTILPKHKEALSSGVGANVHSSTDDRGRLLLSRILDLIPTCM